MYIKKLIIQTPEKIIRDMEFHAGLNLIIDNTKYESDKATGNNVGKTTVLKLIDFCLGAKPNIIYKDSENVKVVYDVVKEFLIDEEVMITLILTDDLDDVDARTVEISRNFLNRKKTIRKINGKEILEKEFQDELEKMIFPEIKVEKPTFRQIISHNIRYKDDSINKTLKTLDKFTTDVEYETLYLHLLGCTDIDGAQKQALTTKIAQEQSFKERLEKNQNRTAYEIALGLLESEIESLNQKKTSFNLNESLEQDLEELNMIKYHINKISSTISKLEIRRNLIEEAKSELESNASAIDMQQLKVLYQEVTVNIDGIHKSFEDLTAYHDKMILEKVKFISQDLPELKKSIAEKRELLNELLMDEKEMSNKISKGDTFEELEKVISELNEKYRLKGEYESIISQVTEVENNIKMLNEEIEKIDEVLFSDEFEERLKAQLMKFNRFFASVSQELYGESYALGYDKTVGKTGRQVYKFNAFNANMSSGKKQGEILCFDLAYLMFAEKEGMSCLKFLLNDKKELMHDNQLIKVAEFVENKSMQLVISILKDKLPEKALESAHVVVELSQNDKLFRIE